MITETDCLLIQDPVAVLLQCKGIPFLGVTQINLIKIDKSNQNFVSKDLLREETISIGIQVLHLKGISLELPNGKDGDWVCVRVRPGTEPGNRRTGVDPRDGIPL